MSSSDRAPQADRSGARRHSLLGLLIAPVLAGCQTAALPPLETVSHVDLPRFMGDWYVIANIPTLLERGAHNAVESYRLAPDGTIDTTFTFRRGSFDGEAKRYTPRGFVRDSASNAVWGMQFIWPLESDYRIVYLAADYSQTAVAREKRDYVWIMARTPQIPEADLERIIGLLGAQGYDTAAIQRVPQQWPAPE
jgi:apolipoprotein D and lipocalin family protein